MRTAVIVLVIAFLPCHALRAAEPVVLFDFAQGAQGWTPAHHVANVLATSEGLEFDCVGNDPYIISEPVGDLPLGDRVLLTIRMRSDADSSGEVFFGRAFRASDSVRFTVNADGQWHDYDMLLPAQAEGARLRIDPASGEGHVALAWIKAIALKPISTEALAAPAAGEFGDGAPTVRAGNMSVVHSEKHWDQFGVRVDGLQMARSHGRPQLGIVLEGRPVYLDLENANTEVRTQADGTVCAVARLQDSGGAVWQFRRLLSPRCDGAVAIETEVTVDQQRDVFHLPVVTLLAGVGTFGPSKTQAVLPGVEYLADEPSSSEADVRGAKADRRIVDDMKLCFPMMSVAADGRYVGLVWSRRDHPAVVFDSPDRIFGSGGHLMALWYPGVGKARLENELHAFRPFTIAANTPLPCSVTVIGGRGETIEPAVRQYVKLAGGLPPLPEYQGGFEAAVELLAHGWLDSSLNEDGTWRHAVWGDRFPAHPAADAPGYMLWLAEHTADDALAERLRAGAQRGLSRLGEPGHWEAHCSHVARPFAPLLFGAIEPYAARRLTAARQALAALDEKGLVYYRPRPGKPDYGETHWEDHANGLNAVRLEPILEAAVFAGDDDLATAALAVLDKQLAVYRNTIPRGAQTWEMPLHTPDILAAARMLACCNLAYQLSGDQKYLEAGREWAWSGMSMVYLDPPTDGPVGLYATTAVLGATNWNSPYWIGLPVQWCGLVYRSSVQEFARLDPEQGAFWGHLAAGITRSGLQQSFPLDDAQRQGLLPDFFHLREQRPDGPAISPGTVQANVAEAYGKTPIYTVQRVGPDGMLMHVPGGIGRVVQTGPVVRVEVVGWSSKPYWLRLVRVPAVRPRIELEGGKVLETDHNEDRKTLNVRIDGKGPIVLSLVDAARADGESGD